VSALAILSALVLLTGVSYALLRVAEWCEGIGRGAPWAFWLVFLVTAGVLGIGLMSSLSMPAP
jgi:hypothetical protein